MPATRLSARVVARLTQAEACEPNPHYRDDLQIARLTVHYAATGEAVLCPPHVLASYAVLGLHPEKVWPAIQARRKALGICEETGAPPALKKPAQSVKLWAEKYERRKEFMALRAANSDVLRDRTISVPMAAPSISAAYPNPDAPSSGKRGEYSYDELIDVVKRSGADSSIREVTLAALVIRGRWPKKQGPVSPVITVSVRSLQDECGVWRSTIQRRIRRAQKDRFWRATRTKINSWLNCPSCGAERDQAKCPKCPHKGNGLNPNEFPRTFAYAIDIDKFATTPPCKQVRQIRELKARGKGYVAEMPKPPEQNPPPKNPAPARREEPARKTAEHQKERTVVETEIMQRATKAAGLLMEMCGLADMGAMTQIAISINAEAKYRGIDIEEAGKCITECALRDHREKGVDLTRFYFRDLKWRTNGGQQKTAAQGRAERSQQQIAEALRRFNRDSEVDCSAGPFDGTELKE